MNETRQAAAAGKSVDVVIPMRNGAKTIGATLASVFAQTVQPRRIIVVDDGSTDGGAALIGGDPLVEVVQTPPLGVSHARNVGMKASRADYIAYLDCDDLWRPDKLERQLEIVARDDTVDAVMCDQLHLRMDGTLIPWTKDAPRLSGDIFEDLLATCFMQEGWSSSILVRRGALLGSGGFDERLRFGEDLDLCLRLARTCVFGYSPECLTFIRENPESTTRKPTSPEEHLEIALQRLSVIEKWIPGRNLIDPIFAQCARLVLVKFARGPMRYDRLMAFRLELANRAPGLAAKIAGDETRFVLILAMFAILQFPRLAIAGFRYWAKGGSFRRAAGSRRVVARRLHWRGGFRSPVPLGNVSDVRPQ